MAESEKELKSILMKMKEESKKAGLKLNIQKPKTMASSFIMANRWGNNDRLYFLRLQNHCRWCLLNPHTLEPVLHSKRSHHNEKPVHLNKE